MANISFQPVGVGAGRPAAAFVGQSSPELRQKVAQQSVASAEKYLSGHSIERQVRLSVYLGTGPLADPALLLAVKEQLAPVLAKWHLEVLAVEPFKPTFFFPTELFAIVRPWQA